MYNKKIYIAGPITGYDRNERKHTFASVAEELRLKGWDLQNPWDAPKPTNPSWSDCMRADIKMLVDCEAIYLLSGWEKSAGALLEFDIARRIGMEIHFQSI